MGLLYFEDFQVGQTFDVAPVDITREYIAIFAQHFDPQPLHLDEEFAKSTRFGGLVAPGVMDFMLLWAAFVKQKVWGDSFIAGKSTSMEWLAPVFADESLHTRAVVSKVTSNNRYNGFVEFSMDGYNQDDKLVMQSVTEVVLAKNPTK